MISSLKANRAFRFLASVKLAIPLMLLLLVACAAGTIYESRYNAEIASIQVYRSRWFEALLVALWANIFCSTVARLPFRKHHLGFVTTHAGLLTLIAGGMLTSRLGIDGQLYVEEGSADNVVVLPTLTLKSVAPGTNEIQKIGMPRCLARLRKSDLAALSKRLNHGLVLEELEPFVRTQLEYTAAPGMLSTGPSIRIALKNKFASSEEWLHLREQPELQLGPMRMRLIAGDPNHREAKGRDAISHLMEFHVMTDKRRPLRLDLYEKGKQVASLWPRPGKPHKTPWMSMTVELVAMLEESKQSVTVMPIALPERSPLPPSALKINGEWLIEGEQKAVGSVVGDFQTYYGPDTITLPFTVTLEKFRKQDYPGTDIPAGFESEVRINASPRTEMISMNNPLKRDGYTLYQSSYSLRPGRRPISVFSVNRDPGRLVKYSGSLLLVIGIAIFTLMRSSWYRARRGAVS